MSDLKLSAKNYGPASRNFDNDFSLAPFEVIDMGENKVAINFGTMVGYTFIGAVKPQKLLNTKPEESQYLTVAVGDFICIVKSGSTATIEKKSKENYKDANNFALAEIKSQETSGEAVYLEIDQIWTGNIDGGDGGGSVCYGFSRLISVAASDGPPAITASNKIEGGLVHCGDKNFTVPDFDVGSAAGTKKIFMALHATCNMDDDSELILPEVKTSSNASLSMQMDTTIPDNVNPTLPSGVGDIILPVGEIVIVAASGETPAKYTFTPYGCGPFRVSQCAGTLSYSRS